MEANPRDSKKGRHDPGKSRTLKVFRDPGKIRVSKMCRDPGKSRVSKMCRDPRKSRAQDRKLRPGDFAAYRPVCPVRLAYRVVREWGQDAPAERRTPPQSARCPRRAQGAPAERKPLFRGEQKKTFSRYSPNILHSVLISHGTQHRSIARLRSRSVHAGRASQRNTRASAREARRPRCHRRSRAFLYSQPRCPRRSRRCAAAAEPGGPCRWCFAFVAV
jgi:hypothetical protein